MPTNLMLVDSQFPRLDQGENTQESITKLQNYLYMLVEQLRYSLHNLDLSNLNQTAWDEMKLEISKPIYVALENSTGSSAELISTVNELKSTVETQGQSISQFQQTANSLSASVSDLQTGMSTTLRLDAYGFIIQGEDPNDRVEIDGGQLKANTVYADFLSGGAVGLMLTEDEGAGIIEYDWNASTSEFAVNLDSYGALRLRSRNNGAVYIACGGSWSGIGSYPAISSLSLSGSNIAMIASNVYAAGSGANLGTSDFPWLAVYSHTDTIQQSDRNLKNSIEALPDKYVDMAMWLEPKRFRLNSGTSGRYHPGFVAQEVKDGMDLFGIDPLEFGGWVKDKDQDGNEIQMLRYGEFIPILLAAIQRLGAKVEALEGKI